MQFTKEEREQIIRTLRVLCEAKANFWDALRAVEVARGNVELEADGNDLEGVHPFPNRFALPLIHQA